MLTRAGAVTEILMPGDEERLADARITTSHATSRSMTNSISFLR
jgi:hypothetical protein